MATTASLITSVRTKIDDKPGDHSSFKENFTRGPLGNQVGTPNVSFQAMNKRITSGTLTVLIDGAAGAVTTTADGLLRGRFTTTTIPLTSLFATYDFQFFTDAEITEFLTAAGSFVGVSDIEDVVAGLVDALTFKAGSDACFALAARTGMLYDASAGGKAASKGDLAKKYKDLAKDLFDRAVAERTNFYERKGGRAAPAYGSTTTGQRPYTPRR